MGSHPAGWGAQRGAAGRTGAGEGAGTGTTSGSVVLVRVYGPADRVSAELLGHRVDQQLGRVAHVVIDLHDVQFLSVPVLQLLYAVHLRALAAGTRLHVSAEHYEVRRSLRCSGLDLLVSVGPAVEMVVAGLSRNSVDGGSS
jgi:anti-anti-sigma factor